MSTVKKLDTFFCVFCGFVTDARLIDRNDNPSILLDTGWLVPQLANRLFSDESDHKYIGYCSRRCRYVQQQPIRTAGFYNSSPLFTSMLEKRRWDCKDRSVIVQGSGPRIQFHSMDSFGNPIFSENTKPDTKPKFKLPSWCSNKKVFDTPEEAKAAYDTDPELKAICDHLSVYGEHLLSTPLPQPSYEPTGVDRSRGRTVGNSASSVLEDIASGRRSFPPLIYDEFVSSDDDYSESEEI